MNTAPPSFRQCPPNRPFQPKSKAGFVKLEHNLLDSPEWESLPAIAQAAYIAMARKFNGYNNGQISYSARECAKRFRVSKDTASRVLRLLEWRGLIRCTSRGSFNVKTQEAKSSLWELPEYSRPTPQTEESLVRPQAPAGPITGTSNDIPGPIRGTFNRFRTTDLRWEKGAFRRRRKDPREEKEKAEALATLERYRLAAEPNGDGR